MLAFAHFVELAFAPSIVLGLFMAIAWRYVEPGRIRTVLQWIASLLFFIPQPFALYLGAYTSRLRFYQQVLLSLWGFGTGLLISQKLFSRLGQQLPNRGLLWRASNWRQTVGEIQKTQLLINSFKSKREKRPNKLVLALASFAMLGVGVYSGWNVVGDYMLEHDVVMGTAEAARVIRRTRSPNTYQVIIDHKPYGITRDLLAQMNRGDYVEAEVGIASRTILKIRSKISPRGKDPAHLKTPRTDGGSPEAFGK